VAQDARTGRQTGLATRSALAKGFTHKSLSFDRMPRLHWRDSTRVWFTHADQLLEFDLGSGQGKWHFSLPPQADNLEVHASTMNAAYVWQDNVYLYQEGDVAPRKITFDIPGEGLVNGKAVHRFEFGIQKGLFFSPGGDRLAYYHKDERMVASYPILDYAATPPKVKPVRYPLNGGPSHRVELRVYDMASGETQRLQTPGPPDQYLTNVVWGPKGEALYLARLNRDQDHLRVEAYDPATGKRLRVLFEERDTAYVEPEHPLFFLPGREDECLWLSERDGFQHLYRYSHRGGLLGQLTEGAWEVLEIVGYDAPSERVVFTATKNSPLDAQTFSVSLEGGRVRSLTDAPGVYRGVALSERGGLLLQAYSNPQTPRSVEIREVASRQRVRHLHQAEDPLEDYAMGETRLVELTAPDGQTTLYGRLILPPSFDEDQRYPAVVYVYGGPKAQLVRRAWLYNSRLWDQYMAQRGYVVFSLDNRGSAHRGKAFEQAVYRRLGSLELADQKKGVEYLRSLPYVDDKRMGVHGWSYGGFMTSSLMCREKVGFAVGVAGGAVVDWRLYEVMYGERYMDTYADNPEGFDRSNLMRYVDSLEQPLIMMHGTADDVVLPQHSMRFLEKAVARDKPVQYLPYPGKGHNWGGVSRLHLYRQVTQHLDQYLRPGEEQPTDE
jgi:dipeptidyl-peptidase-4